jgi:hypothetical protein
MEPCVRISALHHSAFRARIIAGLSRFLILSLSVERPDR